LDQLSFLLSLNLVRETISPRHYVIIENFCSEGYVEKRGEGRPSSGFHGNLLQPYNDGARGRRVAAQRGELLVLLLFQDCGPATGCR
jgi:hypothetical protein